MTTLQFRSREASAPRHDVVSRSYDEWHAREDYFDGGAPWHEALKPFLNDLSGKRVLEIGCGRGGFSTWLGCRPERLRAAATLAADFSDIAVQKAERLGRSRGVAGVAYAVRDIMAIAEPSASFDVVISCETIEHVASPRAAIRELARIVRPGGTVCLTFPSYTNAMGLLRIYKAAIGETFTEGGQPINHWLRPGQVCRWLTGERLEIVRRIGLGHFVPWPRRAPVRITGLDRFGLLTRWSALHQVVIAEKRS